MVRNIFTTFWPSACFETRPSYAPQKKSLCFVVPRKHAETTTNKCLQNHKGKQINNYTINVLRLLRYVSSGTCTLLGPLCHTLGNWAIYTKVGQNSGFLTLFKFHKQKGLVKG